MTTQTVRVSAVGNAQWVAFGQLGKIVLQLVSLATLARLLTAPEYGVMAMATVVTNLALLLRDLGTAAAVVQKQELNDRMLDSVFWLNLVMGVAVGAGLAIGAVPIGHLFGSAELPAVLWALALVFPITASATTHQALLERRSAFRAIAQIELGSLTLGVGCAIAAALAGWGVFSLVVQALVNASVSTLLLWHRSAWRPGWQGRWSELKGIAGFSGNLSLFQFINYFSRNADGMVIGRFLGATVLGYYSMAYRLMMFPLQSLTVIATRALYPIMSRQQTRVGDMATLYLRTVALIAAITAPMMAGLFAVRHDFVAVAFGAKWAPVADILAWLAPTGFVQSIMSSVGAIYMARGRTDLLMRLGVFTALTQVAAFWVGAQFDVLVLAALYLSANLLNAVPLTIVTMRLLERKPLAMLRAVVAPVGAALLMAAAMHLVVHLCGEAMASPLVTLALACSVGAPLYLLLLRFVFRYDFGDVKALLSKPR